VGVDHRQIGLLGLTEEIVALEPQFAYPVNPTWHLPTATTPASTLRQSAARFPRDKEDRSHRSTGYGLAAQHGGGCQQHNE
jgi:hypothetical protein